jgi:hypothetical protein
LILSLPKITPRNFFIYLQKKLLPENFFGLKFFKKSFLSTSGSAAGTTNVLP